MEKYKDDILFDIYEAIPFELSSSEAKTWAKDFYKKYGQLKAASLCLMETNFDRGVDWSPLLYKYARKTALEQI